MGDLEKIVNSIQIFMEDSFSKLINLLINIFGNNVDKTGWFDPKYYGFVYALIALLIIIMIVGLVSFIKNHGKLFTFVIIICIAFGVLCLIYSSK